MAVPASAVPNMPHLFAKHEVATCGGDVAHVSHPVSARCWGLAAQRLGHRGGHRCDQFLVTADCPRCRHPRPRSAAGTANSPQPVEKASICITLITWPK